MAIKIVDSPNKNVDVPVCCGATFTTDSRVYGAALAARCGAQGSSS